VIVLFGEILWQVEVRGQRVEREQGIAPFLARGQQSAQLPSFLPGEARYELFQFLYCHRFPLPR
jgi:hypothetical protein